MSDYNSPIPGYSPPSPSVQQTGNHFPPPGDLAYLKEYCHRLKQIAHELKRRNDMEKLELYIRFEEIAQERGGVFDCNCSAMLRELEQPKRKTKSKKHGYTIFDEMSCF